METSYFLSSLWEAVRLPQVILAIKLPSFIGVMQSLRRYVSGPLWTRDTKFVLALGDIYSMSVAGVMRVFGTI